MKTDALVDLLARNAPAVAAHAAGRRFGTALLLGLAGAAVLMMSFLGINPALAATAQLALFWVKLVFVAGVAAGGAFAVRRLAIPGARLESVPAALIAPLAGIWAMGAVMLIAAAPAARIPLVLGETWRVCAFNIALLSVPAFAASLWAMKGLAPTRLRLAGAAAGLYAAAIGTLVYTLHCPELAPPFLGTWYVLGMLIPTAVGAAIGPRVLRW